MTASDLFIQLAVKRPDGAHEDLVVEATRVLLGSGAHCDVRIAGEGAAPEHVVLELRGQALVAVPRHLAPAARSGGQPLLAETTLKDGDDVSVAGTRVRARVMVATARKAERKTKQLVSMLVFVVGMLALPGIVYAALRQEPGGPLGPAPTEVTALFDQAVTTCAVAAPDQALVLATRQRGTARVLREQHPFAVADGLAAVTTFEQAAACFTTAGHAADAADSAHAAEALRKELDNDYLVHRVRLEHALDVDDAKAAAREVKILRRLTVGRRGAYLDWLGIVERHLEATARS
jgi:hypothetical protein